MAAKYTVNLDSVRAKTIVSGFIGWHDTRDDGSFKTRGAIACNKLKDQILASFTTQSSKPINYLDSNSDVTEGQRLFYQTLYKGQSSSSQMGLDRRMALFKPAVIWVTGPSAQAKPTLCKLDKYIVPLPLFDVIKHKATVEVNKAYTTFVATNRYDQSDIDSSTFKKNDSVAQLFYDKNKDSFNDVVLDLVMNFTGTEDLDKKLKNKKKLPIAVACLLHATAVQHMCDIDAGVKFRDKRGRQAAFDELQSAVNTLLYAT